MANRKAMRRPDWPPIRPPTAMSRPPRAAIRVQVLNVFERLCISAVSGRTRCGDRAAARGKSFAADHRQNKARHGQRMTRYPADTVQQRPAPPYLLPLIALAADEGSRDALALEIARDVACGADPGPEDVRAASVALDWLVESLRAGPVPGVRALRTLRDQAAAEARAVRPMQPVLDRALSAGWVLWGWVAGRHELTADGLRALGDALLRTGDAAAAAIADAHAAAEREI